jgi:hypothetical protein
MSSCVTLKDPSKNLSKFHIFVAFETKLHIFLNNNLHTFLIIYALNMLLEYGVIET